MDTDLIALAFVGMVLLVLLWISIARGWIRPVGFLPGRPSGYEIVVVALAVAFVGALFAVAYSSFASTALITGLGALFAAIIMALSTRKRRE